MILCNHRDFRATTVFEVTEGVHPRAIALRFPCSDNELKGRAQRALAGEHLIAETMISGV